VIASLARKATRENAKGTIPSSDRTPRLRALRV